MRDRPPLAGVLFDKDGTLLDFEATWGPATAAVLAVLAAGDRACLDDLARSCGFDPDRMAFAPHSPIIAGDTGAFAPAWAARLGLPYDQGFARRVDALYREESLRSLTVYADVRPALSALRRAGLRIGLATNDSEATARAHLDRIRAAGLFDFVCGYDTGHGAKPAAGMVTAFAAAIGAPPGAVVLVGDSPHDIAAARAAGARAIGIARTEAARAALGDMPDLVIPTLGDLAAALAIPGSPNECPTEPIR